jgi:hypothetical protein
VSGESEAVVLGMWDDYDREGLPGILRWAADDAVWRPHSSSQSVFRSTPEYRADMERALAEGIRVQSIRLGIWSHDDVVAVRGRIRVQHRGKLDDSRRNPCPPTRHRVRDGKVHWTASSPDLARLLADAGLPGRANEAYMAMHGAEDVA